METPRCEGLPDYGKSDSAVIAVGACDHLAIAEIQGQNGADGGRGNCWSLGVAKRSG